MGWYSRFIEHVQTTAQGVGVEWGEEQRKAFEALKVHRTKIEVLALAAENLTESQSKHLRRTQSASAAVSHCEVYERTSACFKNKMATTKTTKNAMMFSN